MDEETKKAILQSMEEYNKYLLWMVRDKHNITIEKVRSSVFFNGISFEAELKVDDPEGFEETFQEYVKMKIIEEAKRAHREHSGGDR